VKSKLWAGAILLVVWVGLTFVLLVRLPHFLARHGSKGLAAAGKVKVVVTIPILKDFVDQTCGQYAHAESIVGRAGEVLGYRPKPRDVISVYEADLLVKVGAGLDSWVDRIVADLQREDLPIVDLSKSVSLLTRNGRVAAGPPARSAGEIDPFFWLDPGNVRQIVLAIHMGLLQVLPEARKYLEEQREAYFAELDYLESELASQMAKIASKKIVADSDGFSYFARRFNLAFAGRLDQFLPRLAEPIALRTVADRLRAGGVKIIVTDELPGHSLARRLSKMGPFSLAILAAPTGGSPNSTSYKVLMLYDARSLAAAAER